MRRKKNGRGRPKTVQKSKKPSKKETGIVRKLIDSGTPTPDVSVLGYTKTGPTSYRVGSTHVKLESSEDDIQPIFKDSEIVLEVECGSNSALMYLSRLCQGSKGQCIEYDGAWISPNDFQMISGRETAKDWKRSIRHYGRSLKLLINKGILTIHPAACRCDSCRLLTQTTACEPPRKIERNSKELKQQIKSSAKDCDQKYTDSAEDSIDTDINNRSTEPFKYESDSSKADSESGGSESADDYNSEVESLSGDVPELKPNSPHAYPVITEDKVDCVEEIDVDDDEDGEDSDTIIDDSLETVSDSKADVEISLEKWTFDKCNNNLTNKELAITSSASAVESDSVELHNQEPVGREDLEEVLDDQRSDSTDDTPLSVVRNNLQGTFKTEEEKAELSDDQDNEELKDSCVINNDSLKDQIHVDDSEKIKAETPPLREKPNSRSPEKFHGHHRESRLSNIINHLRTSKEKLSPLEPKQSTMSESLLFPTVEEVSHNTDKHSKDRTTPDEPKDEKPTGSKDLEMGEIRRNSSSGPSFDSSPIPPSSIPQPMVPPSYFGVPFDPQYPMLGLSLQHLFAQNLATSYGMNGMTFPPKPFPDLPTKSKQSSVSKSPAATMTKEEYDKQKTTSPISANPQPRFTSSPVGSSNSSLTSPNYSAEKAAVMAKLTEKLAKISEKPPEVIDKTVKNVIKRAKRMQKLEKLQAKLKKNDFVSPIAGKSNKEYYRDRSPERQPQRYGDPSLRGDKKQLPTNPPPAHQSSKQVHQPSFLPTPGLSAGYPYSAEIMANISPIQIPLPSLQMWQSCFPFTMPPPGLETTRFTQFFHNLNGGLVGNSALKRSAEETVVDLSSKKQKHSHSESSLYRDSGSEHHVTSLHSSPRIHSLPTMMPSPNNSSGSPESSSSPFLSNGAQLNLESSSPISTSTSFSSVTGLAGQYSINSTEESVNQPSEGFNDGQSDRRIHKLNGFNNSTWSDYERKKSSMECTCDFKHVDDIRVWSSEDVCRFMKKLDGCGPYIETFRRAGVDGSSLPLLTTDSLTKSLGMKLGPALVLTGAVARKAREISKIVPCTYCRKKIQRG